MLTSHSDSSTNAAVAPHVQRLIDAITVDDAKLGALDWIKVRWQSGPVAEYGVNGAQVQDVIRVAMERLDQLNRELPCRENRLALASLREAVMDLDERTRARRAQDVEGLKVPHAS